METLTGGRIWVGGELIGIEERKGKLHIRNDKDIARQRSRIGMVFQRFNLFPHMTALENVMEAPIQVKRLPQGRRPGPRRWSCWRRSGWPTGPTTTPPSCPAGSSSGWRSPGRWP